MSLVRKLMTYELTEKLIRFLRLANPRFVVGKALSFVVGRVRL